MKKSEGLLSQLKQRLHQRFHCAHWLEPEQSLAGLRILRLTQLKD